MSAATMAIAENEPTPDPTRRTIQSRIGAVEIVDANVLAFPRGLLGFEGASEYAVLTMPTPGMERFKLLQSLHNSELGFVVTEASAAANSIDATDLLDAYKHCGVKAEDALTLLIVSFRRENGGVEMSANLRAPIVTDVGRKIGRQHVMSNGRYAIRFTL